MLESFAVINVVNSSMASSYGDNDKVMYEDSKKKKRFVHCEKTKEIVKHVLKVILILRTYYFICFP